MTRRAIPAVLINDTSIDRHHGCNRVMRTLRALAAERGIEIIASAPAHADWRDRPDVIRALDRAKLIIVNGEGTLHHGARQAGVILAIAAFARAEGVPAALINASWESNPPHFAGMASAFAIVSVRDRRSQRAMENQGIKATCAPDLSLYSEPLHTGAAPRSGTLFSDSVIAKSALELARRRRHLGASAISLFEKSRHDDIAWNARVAISRAAASSGFTLLSALRDSWPAVGPGDSDDTALIERIGRAQVLVSGRFHAACFALLARTPLICVPSNSQKIEALAEDAGLSSWRTMIASQVNRVALERAAKWDAGELDTVNDYLADGRRATRALFDELSCLS